MAVYAGFRTVGGGGGGLTSEQEAVLAALSVSGGALRATAPVIHVPQSVSDWSTLPAGWAALSPHSASSLTYATAVVPETGGTTLQADSSQAGIGAGSPSGVVLPLHRGLGSLDVTVVFDEIAIHGALSSGYAWLDVAVMGPTTQVGGYAVCRLLYKYGAAGNSGDPTWFAQKGLRRPNANAEIFSSKLTVQEAAANPASASLRLVLADGLRTFRAYYGATELGGGDVGTGAVDWSGSSSDATSRTVLPEPLRLVVSLQTGASSSPASSARLTSLTVA